MRALRLIILLATGGSLALAQLDSDTLTVSVSQSFGLQPDQARFSAYMNTGVNTGLDEVITTLKSVGITTAIFTDVYSGADPLGLHWFFTLSVPISQIKPTIAQLTGLKIRFSIEGLQVSQQLRDAQLCSMSNLMASAQSQAKKMAGATELDVGDVLTLSDENTLIANYSISVQKVYGPNQVSGVLQSQQSFSPPCSLTVKFKLLRYHY